MNEKHLSVPQSYIRKAYHRDTDTEITCLVELGILKTTGYTEGKCRGWRVIWPELVWAFITPITKSTAKTFLALSNSKKVQTTSDIAREANKAISVGLMNLTAVIDYFDCKVEQEGTDWDYLMTELGYVLGCWHDRENWDEASGTLTYRQHFHTSAIGGRVYAKSGDALVSRELKQRWFNIANVRNYDLKAAHVAIFNQIKPTKFADNWVNDTDDFRQRLAKAIGVPLRIIKQSILALTYSGKATPNSKCDIYKLFLEHCGDNEQTTSALAMFNQLTREYQEALADWYKSIKANLKKYQKNAIGLVTDNTDPKSLASHYLQGKEQEAIRWIGSRHYQTRHRYQVISNQYDGLITVGNIPDTVIAQFFKKFQLTLEIKSIT